VRVLVSADQVRRERQSMEKDAKRGLVKIHGTNREVLLVENAVRNTAKVEPGSSVAVFGLGGTGIAVVIGAVMAGFRIWRGAWLQ
jgi:hypothetical protein